MQRPRGVRRRAGRHTAVQCSGLFFLGLVLGPGSVLVRSAAADIEHGARGERRVERIRPEQSAIEIPSASGPLNSAAGAAVCHAINASRTRINASRTRSAIACSRTRQHLGHFPANNNGAAPTATYAFSTAPRDTWRTGGHPWSTVASQPAVGGFRLGGEDPRLRAGRATVDDAIGKPGTTLLDVRSAAEYRGDCFWPSGGAEPGGQTGHVPSAVHQPIDGLYNGDGSFRCAAELRGVFSPAVLNGGEELII